MLIGVISDTHNDIGCIRKAVNFFNLRNADLVLHCGDIFSPFSAKEFSKLNCGFKAVYGNNDIERSALENIISEFGMIQEAPFEFKISGKLFIMAHRPLNIGIIVADGKHDYVLYGHLHKASIEKQGKTTILNPGEACGQRYGRKTIALIDLVINHTEIFDLDNLF
ncbi:MAG: metallophosphoesterase [Endomicrobium sp.]|jgi:putative phosphoesterase|nr:metallophosphoesterase [Endomicrobium sp.]